MTSLRPLRIFAFSALKGLFNAEAAERKFDRLGCARGGALKRQIGFRKVGIPDAAVFVHEANLLVKA